jgi:hypothetical protein
MDLKPLEAGEKKKPKWVKKFMVLLPVLLMAGYAMGSIDFSDEEQKPENLIEVGGYSFYALSDGTFGTFVQISDTQVPIAFRLNPEEAKNISLGEDVVRKIITSSKVYLTVNPNQDDLGKIAVAAAEVSRITALFGIDTVAAYTEDSEPINPSVPLKSCEDATEEVPILFLDVGRSTGIWLEDNCVVISGETSDDLILSADKLGYNLIGIKI